jgi:preprotein translocase subunit SecY
LRHIVTLTRTLLLMEGEIMTEYGVGNGVSLIIYGGIVARLIPQIGQTLRLVQAGEVAIWQFLLDVVVILGSILAVVVITQAVRKIPVQYAKRVVGRRVYGGQSTHLPLRVNQAGVIPIIFAISVLQFRTIAQFPAGAAAAMGQEVRRAVRSATCCTSSDYRNHVLHGRVVRPERRVRQHQKYEGFIPGIRRQADQRLPGAGHRVADSGWRRWPLALA